MAKKSAPKEKSIPRDYYDLFKENPYTTEEVVKVCLWSLGIIMNFSKRIHIQQRRSLK